MATGGERDSGESTDEYWSEMEKELDERNVLGQQRMFTRAQMTEAKVSKHKYCRNSQGV